MPDRESNQLSVRDFDPTSILPPPGCPRPFALPREWPLETPIDLEIGCGVGWHPVGYAQRNPARFLIAIEHTREKFEKFLSRYDSHGCPANLLPVHADAVAWVTHAMPPDSLSRILLMYPNPNPKNPAKRWFRMPFMHRLLDSLVPDGELTLATNEKDYADEARRYGIDFWKLELVRDLELNRELTPAHQPRTHFEKKYLDRGQTCFDLVFRRRRNHARAGSGPK